LIFRNAARIAAVTYVSAAVLIVGKLFISSIVTVSAYYYIIESGLVDELYSVGGPVSIVVSDLIVHCCHDLVFVSINTGTDIFWVKQFLISYWLSDFFMDVLDMGISTVLHCFIADEEMFEPDQRYCDRSLKDYVDNHGGE
jgi:choline transporter-like protein 2/4/5